MCTEILQRDLVESASTKILLDDLLQRSCVEICYRHLVQRSCIEITDRNSRQRFRWRELTQDLLHRTFHGYPYKGILHSSFYRVPVKEIVHAIFYTKGTCRFYPGISLSCSLRHSLGSARIIYFQGWYRCWSLLIHPLAIRGSSSYLHSATFGSYRQLPLKKHASISRTCRSQKVSRVWQSLVVPSVTISVQLEHTGTIRTAYENHHVS